LSQKLATNISVDRGEMVVIQKRFYGPPIDSKPNSTSKKISRNIHPAKLSVFLACKYNNRLNIFPINACRNERATPSKCLGFITGCIWNIRKSHRVLFTR